MCIRDRALRADDGSVAFFPIYQGTLPWQPNNVEKMLVNFCLVTPEMTGLICIRLVMTQLKTSGISPDILDRFLQAFHHMKALYVQLIDLSPIFQFGEGRCHGNQIIVP